MMGSRLPALGLVVMSVFQAIMILRYEVNWDEFLNLSMLYDHQRGELMELLQTGFVHLIAWVPKTAGNEVGQVVAARFVVAVFALSTSWGIYAVSRALTSSEAGAFAVLVYWSFSFVFIHGIELRTDPMAIGLIMPALWLAITRAERLVPMVFAGALTGLAGVLTIKAIFFVPSLIVVALIRAGSEQGAGKAVVAVLCAGAAALVAFWGAVGLHSLTFDDYASPFAFLDRTTAATLGGGEGSLFLHYALPELRGNLLQCALGLVGLCLAAWLSIRGRRRIGLYGLALALPLLVPLVYRDVYPYFYAMLLAPVAPLSGFAFAAAVKRSRIAGPFLVAGLLAMSAGNMAREWNQTNATQRVLLGVLNELFDADAAYIDGRSMVASRPKVGLFMSAWGMRDYRRDGRPVMGKAIADARPVFLLRTNWQLDLEGFTPEEQESHSYGLLAEDVRALRDAFVPFWGPVYVAGARFSAGATLISLHLDGPYRNMSEGKIGIGSQTVLPGQTVDLESGSYTVRAEKPGQLRLDLPMPTAPSPKEPLIIGF